MSSAFLPCRLQEVIVFAEGLEDFRRSGVFASHYAFESGQRLCLNRCGYDRILFRSVVLVPVKMRCLLGPAQTVMRAHETEDRPRQRRKRSKRLFLQTANEATRAGLAHGQLARQCSVPPPPPKTPPPACFKSTLCCASVQLYFRLGLSLFYSCGRRCVAAPRPIPARPRRQQTVSSAERS